MVGSHREVLYFNTNTMIISDKYYVYTRGPIDYFTLLVDEYELIGQVKKSLFNVYGPGRLTLFDDDALRHGLQLIADGTSGLAQNNNLIKPNTKVVIDGFFVVYNPTSSHKHTDTEVGYLMKLLENGTTIIALPYKIEGADNELLGEFTMQ